MPTEALGSPASWPMARDRRGGARRAGVSAAIVAHELAQPLAALTANLDVVAHYLARESVSLEAVREVFADVLADIARADAIVRHVLALVRREPTARSAVDVGRWLAGCAERRRREAARLGIGVEVVCDAGLQVDADVMQLDRAVDNLVGNALQAIASFRTHGRVLIEGRRAGHEIVVSVSDDGPGFHHAVLAAPGARLTTKVGGSGLGLVVARMAASAHRGGLEVGNGVRGAVVMLRLPAGLPAAQQSQAPQAGRARRRVSRRPRLRAKSSDRTAPPRAAGTDAPCSSSPR